MARARRSPREPLPARPPAPRAPDPQAPKARTDSEPRPPECPHPAPSAEGDPLSLVTPTRETGAGASACPPTATENGGASGAEDTSRGAGYVADLARKPAAPPGAPVELDPAQLIGPADTAKASAERARKAPSIVPRAPTTPPPRTPPSKSASDDEDANH